MKQQAMEYGKMGYGKKRPMSLGRRRFLKVGAAAAVAAIGTPVYGAEWEPNHPQVARRDIKLKGWPASAAGLKIGQLSDLHCQNEGAVARTAHAARLLLAEKPDIVFLTGDYISGGYSPRWVDASAQALAPLQVVPGGVFAILGNHDYADGHSNEMTHVLERAGFCVLRNRAVPFPSVDTVWIVGMESVCAASQDPIKAMHGVPKDAVKILLVHEPDYADEAPLGFSLQLSGHSHAGQIRIPGLPPLHCPAFGRRYPEGLQQAENHLVYTTRGVGMMGPQIRFCCPPEITVLRLYPA